MPRQQLILDRYRVIDEAGSGGYGTVQHAYDTRLKRDVAIKCIELSEAEVARARLVAMEEKLRSVQADWDDGSSWDNGGTGEPGESGESSEPRQFEEAENLEYAPTYTDHEVEALSDGRAAREALPWEDEPQAPSAYSASPASSARALRSESAAVPSTPVMSVSPAEEPAAGTALPRDPAFLDAREARLRNRRKPTRRKPGSTHVAAPAADAYGDAFASPGSPGPSSFVSAFDRLRAGKRAGRGVAAQPAAAGSAHAGASPHGVPHPAAAAGAGRSVVDPDDIDDDDLFEHIPGLEEARTAAHLNDANIVTVYDCEVHGSTAYVIMEYVEGKTLSAIMRELGDDITLDIVAAVFTSISHALEVAHDSDVLHLDIKPENVIVNSKGVVKVADFGLATLMDASGRATTGAGTIGYMPLEQMRQEDLDVRADEWALASLTYEMLSGSNPFAAETLREAEERIENAELVLPSLCWDDLDAGADDVIFTALDPDPDERYDTVAEFAEELTPFLGSTRTGKRALAALVKGETEEEETPQAPRPPAPPLIDRLGPVGAAVVGRAASAAAVAMVVAVSLVNLRVDASATFGLATTFMPAFWIVLAACVALAAWRPRFGVVPALVAFFVMLLFNQDWGAAALVAVVGGAWWWIAGRTDDSATIAALLQPLAGSFGMAALAPVVAGALLSVRDAALTALFAVAGGIAFASLGSADLMNWNIVANGMTPASGAIAGPHLTGALVDVLTSPQTWCVAVSWVLAAVVFALFCLRGTRSFDIAGAVAAAVLLVVGVVAGAGLDGMLAQMQAGESSAAPLFPDPLTVFGALVPGVAGIAMAVMGVTDRVRLEEGEW